MPRKKLKPGGCASPKESTLAVTVTTERAVRDTGSSVHSSLFRPTVQRAASPVEVRDSFRD